MVGFRHILYKAHCLHMGNGVLYGLSLVMLMNIPMFFISLFSSPFLVILKIFIKIVCDKFGLYREVALSLHPLSRLRDIAKRTLTWCGNNKTAQRVRPALIKMYGR